MELYLQKGSDLLHIYTRLLGVFSDWRWLERICFLLFLFSRTGQFLSLGNIRPDNHGTFGFYYLSTFIDTKSHEIKR